MDNNTPIYILGAGAQAGKALALCSLLNLYVKGFVSTDEIGTFHHGLPVLGSLNEWDNLEIENESLFHISIGEPFIRQMIFEQLEKIKVVNYQTLIHPSSYLAKSCTIYNGVFIGALSVIENYATIGSHSIIDSGAIVEHNCSIGSFVNISPGAVLAGGVEVGANSIVGVGATIRENIVIGLNTVIGAGAVIINNVPDNAVVVGNPAKIIRYKSTNERTFK